MKETSNSTKSLENSGKIKKQFTHANRFYFRSGMLLNTSYSRNSSNKPGKQSLNSIDGNNQNPIKSINLSEFAYQLANA